MTNTLDKIIHNGEEYKFPGIPNDTTGTTSIVSNIWAGTSSEYNLITPKEGQLSIVLHEEGGGGWQPGVNTIAYYTFKNTLVGEVGGTATLTNGTSDAGYVTLSAGGITVPLIETLTTTQAFTASIWVYPTQWNGNTRLYNDNNRFRAVIEGSYLSYQIALNWEYENSGSTSYATALSLNAWFNIIITYSGSGNTVYVYNNGVKYTYTHGFDTNRSVSNFLIGLGSEAFSGRVADLIVEKAQRTDQECTDYFNQTKGDYGIS